jgi:hypothetical protein
LLPHHREARLREKIRKIEALFAGAGTARARQRYGVHHDILEVVG